MRRAGVLGVFALVAIARADVDSQRRAMEEVRDKIEYFGKKCGGRIAVAIDWPSFKYKPGNDELSAGAYCGDVVDSMGWICDNDEHTRGPMQRIHTVRCGFDASLGRELRLELRGDVLSVRLSWDTDNVGDRLKAWIENLPAGDPAAVAGAPSGGGLSVRQSRERAVAQPKLDELAAGVRDACGVGIPVVLDWASFEGHFGGGSNESSAVGWCAQQVEQIGKMCKRNAEEKRTIARELRSATCRWDGSATKDFKFALSGSALSVGYTFESADSGDNLLRYLWNTLE